ncbi:MAG: alpha/beta hydrolase-fold protein [Bacteroidia bacterium]|nr:alpha/beta hydrolase-fold protein [Bacteroidia bacterium]MDW8134648.1 alpha/beta hydrolase-fold protein [Bacteroidia bacterium]
MQISHHFWEASELGRTIRLNRYGERGVPFLAFPAQDGDHRNLEDFGLISAIEPIIEQGRAQVFTIDSYDKESWTSNLHPAEKALRHEAYANFILREIVPFIKHTTQATPWTTGVSMGAYHAANFLFRFPFHFDGVIALSGIYELSQFIGEYSDENVYFNTPLWFLSNLQDPYYLDEIRKKKIVLCVGQGAWEEPMLSHTRRIGDILREKNIPAWVDIWGPDVYHDWPWWHRQLPYFMDKVLP